MPTNLLDTLLAFRSKHRLPTDAAVGGLLGAALGGGTTALTKQRAGESRQERRARLLRNAVAGGVMGGGAGAALGSIPDMWSKLFPAPSASESAAQGLSDQFAEDKPLGGWLGSAAGMLGVAGTRAGLSRRHLLDHVKDKARDFAGRASLAASEASAEAQRRVDEYRKAVEKAITEHPERVNAEVKNRMESWSKAPEYAAEVQRRLGSATADPSFVQDVDKMVQQELTKNPSRELAAVRAEVENAVRAKLETRIMEALSNTKSREFLQQVQQSMPAPKNVSDVDIQSLMKKELAQLSKTKLAPLAHELQMDWGRSKALGAQPVWNIEPEQLTEQLLSHLQKGNFTDHLTPGRFWKPTGFTGVRPTGSNPLAPGNKKLHALSLLLGASAPFIFRATPPAAAKGLELLENTFKPD